MIIVELGSSSIRAGPLTVDPSLPQSYFPAIANILPNGKVIIGKEALKPDNRIRGHVVKPIRSIEPGNDRYAINMDLMRCLLDKVFTDLRVNPESYKVLAKLPLALLIHIFSTRASVVVLALCRYCYRCLKMFLLH